MSAGPSFNFDDPTPAATGTDAPPNPYAARHPLKLPLGSVRALLTFMILGTIWALLLLPEDKTGPKPVPLYLYYLMFLVIGEYFALRSIGSPSGTRESSPLFLPRGSIRFLIIVGFAAVMGWGFYAHDDFIERLQPSVDVLVKQPFLPVVILAAFFLGTIVTRLSRAVLSGPHGLPGWYQDLQAWVSLLAVLGLVADILIRLVIFPHVTAVRRFEMFHWQSILSGILAFYFGARS
ncbi:MAG: hypothetical protein ACK4RK_15485 [Gemmataceae bacterium]